MKKFSTHFVIAILILFAMAALFSVASQSFKPVPEEPLSKLVQDVSQGTIQKITVAGDILHVQYKDGTTINSRKEAEGSLSQTLLNYGVPKEQIAALEVDQQREGGILAWLGPVSILLAPILLFFFFFFFIFRQAKSGIGQTFDFTKTRARLFGAGGSDKERVTFKDVAGLKEAKQELEEVVDFLKNPKKYLQIGAKIPRGVLLVGPPGTGKTLLAKAVATEAGVPFFSASGSEFIEMFVGVGSSRVRDLFATAKKAGRSIIFIDELDAIGRTRGSGFGGGHDEREQTLNQILVEMDGFDRDDTQIVVAATNRPDVLDVALLRPGRFDRRVMLDLPDVHDREQILNIHAKGKPLTQNVRLREIAERTPGFSGADLANLMNEAAIFAARKDKTEVSQHELYESIDKVLLGPERTSHVLSEQEKKITAFHEAGHALVAASLPNVDPVRKISIVARGRAGGYTLKLPSEDRHMKSRTEFIEELAVLLGGYAAERIVFGDITTGPSNDLEKASDIARSIIKEYGMSEKLGPVVFGERDSNVFLGGPFGEERNYSETTALEIDREVSKLVEGARRTAERIVRQKRKLLDKIANVLIEKETIEKEEFEKLIGIKRSSKKDSSGM